MTEFLADVESRCLRPVLPAVHGVENAGNPADPLLEVSHDPTFVGVQEVLRICRAHLRRKSGSLPVRSSIRGPEDGDPSPPHHEPFRTVRAEPDLLGSRSIPRKLLVPGAPAVDRLVDESWAGCFRPGRGFGSRDPTHRRRDEMERRPVRGWLNQLCDRRGGGHRRRDGASLKRAELRSTDHQEAGQQQESRDNGHLAHQAARHRPFPLPRCWAPRASRRDGDPGHDPPLDRGRRRKVAIVLPRVSAQPCFDVGFHHMATWSERGLVAM